MAAKAINKTKEKQPIKMLQKMVKKNQSLLLAQYSRQIKSVYFWRSLLLGLSIVKVQPGRARIYIFCLSNDRTKLSPPEIHRLAVTIGMYDNSIPMGREHVVS